MKLRPLPNIINWMFPTLQFHLKWLTSKENFHTFDRSTSIFFLPFVLSEMFCLANGRNSLESTRYIDITPQELEIICLPKFWQREIKQLWQRQPPAQASHLVRMKHLLKMFIQHLLSRKTSAPRLVGSIWVH